MRIAFIKITILIASLAMISSTCSKEDDDSSENSTNGKTLAAFNPDISYGTMTDQDGNVYKTVTIGNQTWMAENLRTTIYNDGTPIPNIIDENKWEGLITGAYCNYENTNDVVTIATYGRLYNWYAVNTGLLAPKGWHVPTDDEWTELTDYLGGQEVAGGKLKETVLWVSPNTDATNETGFTALAGGGRVRIGYKFRSIGLNGYWWTASLDITITWYRTMRWDDSWVSRNGDTKGPGFSVRCVKD
jgi:uncharacterized protein (TIGR02145 family)